jgi:cytochrome c peroxidase
MSREIKIALAILVTVFLSALFYPLLTKPGPDTWNTKEMAVLSSLHLSRLPLVPKDPSNAYENRPGAILLGKRLFGDPRFSKNHAVSCINCHDPKQQFQDSKPLSQGMGTTARRAMPLIGSGYAIWHDWDGRKDSLWSQSIGALEATMSHGANRLEVAQLVERHYRADYQAVFGALPPLPQQPAAASPLGSPEQKAAWDKLDASNRENVNRVFANVGKAMAAYQKTLQFGPAPLDQYIDAIINKNNSENTSKNKAGLAALNPAQKRGLRLFIGMGQCTTCHNGPLLTDHAFHNVGVPDRREPDQGRALAIAKVENDEFNCLGRYSDAKPEQCAELTFMNRDKTASLATFKTPSLRNVALRPPYMHAGQFATLDQVVRHYVKAPKAAIGHNERDPLMLDDKEIADLVAFLDSLSGTVTEK